MNPITMARASLTALLFASIMAITLNPNTVLADPPAKTAKLPPPPPVDPLDRIEKAIGKLDDRLKAVESDVATLKSDVAKLKGDKAKTDSAAAALKTRVEKAESRITTLEKRPPLTLKAYKTVYKVDPPTYIYVRKTDLLRETYTYNVDDGKLYIFVVASDNWVLVTK